VAKLKFGIELPQHLGFSYLKDMAQKAEKLGYNSVWIRDHLTIDPVEMSRFPQGYIENGQRKVSRTYLSCVPTVAAIAAVTNRITIGTDIINVPRRNPVDLANEIAAIDMISNGRFIFHVAIGQPTRDWASSGVNYPLKERGKMMEEALDIMKLLWTHDDTVNFNGRYYTIENARIGSRVVQKPHPPIWLGVGTTFKRVAKYATGFTLTSSMFGFKIEDYRASVQKIREAAKAVGRNPDEIEPSARFAIVVGKTDAEAKKRAKDHWTKLWFQEEPWFTEWAGSPETVAGVIRPFIDAGARHILLWPIPYGSSSDPMQDIQMFANEVITRLQK